MLTVPAAIDQLTRHQRVLCDSERIQLHQALNRVLAQDIIATINVPPADNSAMDGYAFRHADYSHSPAALPLSQRIVAGQPPEPLQAGTAARIFTGAEIPAGADTVVMQEHCEASEVQVQIVKVPARGANIRPLGQDIPSGKTVLKTGARIRAQDLGLIASLGVAKIPVFQRLKVSIISTGSELVDPDKQARPGQIYNSNRFILAGLLEQWGFEVQDLGIAPDDPSAIRELMLQAAALSDVVITSGGVSVGEEDHVKAVLESLGKLELWKVAIKPGKPFAFGDIGGTPVLGLPGNPVSVLVTMLVIARPFLLFCQGASATSVSPVSGMALFDSPASSRDEYIRVRAGASGLERFPQQSSGALYSACWGDGLVLQAASESISSGQPVKFLPYAIFS